MVKYTAECAEGLLSMFYRKVGNLVIGLLLPHDRVQEVTVVLERCDAQHPANIVTEVVWKQLQPRESNQKGGRERSPMTNM